MSTREILRDKTGVCREYVKIFSEMCNIAGFRVKCIRGYTKGPDFVPGNYPFLSTHCLINSLNLLQFDTKMSTSTQSKLYLIITVLISFTMCC